MTETKDGGEAEPKKRDGAPDPKASTPAAERADSQNETKDNPDSGQNEDG